MTRTGFEAATSNEVPMHRFSRRGFVAASALALYGGRAPSQPAKTEPPLKLPARAVTRGPRHHWFGYYDKTPWDRTGRYLLAMGTAFCDRQPGPEDAIEVGMVDLTQNNGWVPISSTTAWCWQQGSMLQWLGSAPDREVIFNAIERGKPVAVVKDVCTGKSRTLPLPVYAVSNDGKQAVTLDFARLHRLRPGYGYASVEERLAADPAPVKLGVWWMDLATGKNDLVITLRQLAGNRPDDRFKDAQHWVNHLQFNPSGGRFVFLHRWKKPSDRSWFTRMYTARPDGSDLRLLMDTGMVSHFDWRDDDTLLAWTRTKEHGDRFHLLDVGGQPPKAVFVDEATRDGHCSYSPDRKWVLNDTYPDRDRMQTLMLLKVANGRRYDLNTFHSPPTFTGPTRCDLHPRWNRDGTQVCFDGCHEPTRQVYVVDVNEVVKS
jgi:hypothetical protein